MTLYAPCTTMCSFSFQLSTFLRAGFHPSAPGEGQVPLYVVSYIKYLNRTWDESLNNLLLSSDIFRTRQPVFITAAVVTFIT